MIGFLPSSSHVTSPRTISLHGYSLASMGFWSSAECSLSFGGQRPGSVLVLSFLVGKLDCVFFTDILDVANCKTTTCLFEKAMLF